MKSLRFDQSFNLPPSATGEEVNDIVVGISDFLGRAIFTAIFPGYLSVNGRRAAYCHRS